jgi:hypothetical protein
MPAADTEGAGHDALTAVNTAVKVMMIYKPPGLQVPFRSCRVHCSVVLF